MHCSNHSYIPYAVPIELTSLQFTDNLFKKTCIYTIYYFTTQIFWLEQKHTAAMANKKVPRNYFTRPLIPFQDPITSPSKTIV